MNPYWPPPLSTLQYRLLSNIYDSPLLFPYLTTPSLFFLFVHSRLGHALGILCPKRGDMWGAKLIYLNNLISSGSDGRLGCNYRLNTHSPKTNLKCSSKYMFTSFLQRFTLSLGFPFSVPCSTTYPPHTPPRAIPFFYAL